MEVTQKPRLHQDWIDSHAYGIVKALQKGGFRTYLVGGCVRDLLLGIHPKDFDIATMAHPPQVKRLIYMSYIIGKRFRLVLVKRDEQQFEVATFRREVDPSEFPDGPPMGDNVFGTPEEDARRRDFTINSLFYDPVGDELIDFTDGMKDIKSGIIRMIGDPDLRLIEDPIRILRALRLSHKLRFSIDPELREAITTHASELAKAVLPRKREEILKILRLDDPALTFLEAYDLGVLKYWIPTLHTLFEDPQGREEFLNHFEVYKSMLKPEADTIHLFGCLIFSYFRSVVDMETEEEQEHLVIEKDQFQNFMRDELGMHKFEQSAIGKALQLVPFLQRTQDFRKRGERRQQALLRNEGFPLALEFAAADYQLAGEQILFWRSAYEEARPEIQAEENEQKRERRDRNRRRGRNRPARDRNRSRLPETGNGEDTEAREFESGDSTEDFEPSSQTVPFDDDDLDTTVPAEKERRPH